MRAGANFTHPVTGRQQEGVLVRWLREVMPADNTHKALDMPWVTWECERGWPKYHQISTDSIYRWAYLQASQTLAKPGCLIGKQLKISLLIGNSIVALYRPVGPAEAVSTCRIRPLYGQKVFNT